jgi:predicted Zn finger-like uncharacterized protein
MPTLTSCPSCAKQLKVPDELIGRQVKCPSCGTTFTAGGEGMAPAPPPVAASPMAAPPSMLPRDDYGQYNRGYEAPQPSAPNTLLGPGIALLISSMLNFLLSCYFIVNGFVVANNPAMAVDANPFFRNQNEAERKEMLQLMKVVGPGYSVFGVLGVLFSILTLIGAVTMMKGRKSGLGWTAAILSVIPCTAPCCLAGIPIGIWAMVALNRAPPST